MAVGKPERQLGKLERLCYERMEREHELARQGHPRGFWFDEKAGRLRRQLDREVLPPPQGQVAWATPRSERVAALERS
jgi:hypothetical protein